MAAIPYMPLYVADYMSDAAHLSTLEHGAYLLLIMTYWQRGEALPDDDKKLARICRTDARTWTRLRPVLAEFFTVGCSKWLHNRVERELHSYRDKSLKRRKGGLARAKQMHSTRLADAQLSTEAEAEVVPFPNGNGPAADPEKVMFDSGIRLLMASGKTEAQARALIGRWKRDHGVPEVITGIGEAVRTGATEPVAWLEARWKARAGQAFEYVGGPC